MTEPTAFRLRQLASPRKPKATGRGGRRVVAMLLRLGCVALLAWIGYVHLHLWQEGYRQIPTNGPLFLLDAVAGFALAAVLLVWPRPLACEHWPERRSASAPSAIFRSGPVPG
jgi:hypothetical protein